MLPKNLIKFPRQWSCRLGNELSIKCIIFCWKLVYVIGVMWWLKLQKVMLWGPYEKTGNLESSPYSPNGICVIYFWTVGWSNTWLTRHWTKSYTPNCTFNSKVPLFERKTKINKKMYRLLKKGCRREKNKERITLCWQLLKLSKKYYKKETLQKKIEK